MTATPVADSRKLSADTLPVGTPASTARLALSEALAAVVEIANDAIEEHDALDELNRLGCKPTQPETISACDLALIGIAAKIDRLAESSERQANALERLTELFGAVIGLGDAECGHGGTDYKAVPYLRTGRGGPFNCDENAGPV